MLMQNEQHYNRMTATSINNLSTSTILQKIFFVKCVFNIQYISISVLQNWVVSAFCFEGGIRPLFRFYCYFLCISTFSPSISIN